MICVKDTISYKKCVTCRETTFIILLWVYVFIRAKKVADRYILFIPGTIKDGIVSLY